MRSKPHRKRNKSATVRMTKTEYQNFEDKIADSGLSKQTYMLRALLDAPISPSSELQGISSLNTILETNELCLRNLGNNVNQMARKANSKGEKPTIDQLTEISDTIKKFREENYETWLYFKQSETEKRT